MSPAYINQKGLYAMEAVVKIVQAMTARNNGFSCKTRAQQPHQPFSRGADYVSTRPDRDPVAFLLAAVHFLIFRELRVRRHIRMGTRPRARCGTGFLPRPRANSWPT